MMFSYINISRLYSPLLPSVVFLVLLRPFMFHSVCLYPGIFIKVENIDFYPLVISFFPLSIYLFLVPLQLSSRIIFVLFCLLLHFPVFLHSCLLLSLEELLWLNSLDCYRTWHPWVFVFLYLSVPISQ